MRNSRPSTELGRSHTLLHIGICWHVRWENLRNDVYGALEFSRPTFYLVPNSPKKYDHEPEVADFKDKVGDAGNIGAAAPGPTNTWISGSELPKSTECITISVSFT